MSLFELYGRLLISCGQLDRRRSFPGVCGHLRGVIVHPRMRRRATELFKRRSGVRRNVLPPWEFRRRVPIGAHRFGGLHISSDGDGKLLVWLAWRSCACVLARIGTVMPDSLLRMNTAISLVLPFLFFLFFFNIFGQCLIRTNAPPLCTNMYLKCCVCVCVCVCVRLCIQTLLRGQNYISQWFVHKLMVFLYISNRLRCSAKRVKITLSLHMRAVYHDQNLFMNIITYECGVLWCNG